MTDDSCCWTGVSKEFESLSSKGLKASNFFVYLFLLLSLLCVCAEFRRVPSFIKHHRRVFVVLLAGISAATKTYFSKTTNGEVREIAGAPWQTLSTLMTCSWRKC